MTLDLARLLLSLAAVGVASALLVCWGFDRRTDRATAQAALLLSLCLIAGDTLLRLGQHTPFQAHLFVARSGIVLLAGVYTFRRLRAPRA